MTERQISLCNINCLIIISTVRIQNLYEKKETKKNFTCMFFVCKLSFYLVCVGGYVLGLCVLLYLTTLKSVQHYVIPSIQKFVFDCPSVSASFPLSILSMFQTLYKS